MRPGATRGGESEILPRYIFLEPLLERARILEIGAVAATRGKGARFLIDRGAARVVSVDPDAAAIERAAADPEVAVDGVELRAGDYRELEDGTFDLVILHSGEDLLEEPRLIDALKRKLSAPGRLLVSLAQPGGVRLAGVSEASGDPDALDKSLRRAFPSVEVAAQTAFVGYSITPQGDGEVATALDESLADQSAPAYR